jgi:hypothetical protein
MSAADKRIADLLDRWLASVELHARYLELDDDAYASVQDWPKHQRPTKWVVELARARIVELRRQLEDRRTRGDAAFAESLELMSFLTTLLGSEHIERFIPQAASSPPGDTTVSQKLEAPPKADASSVKPAKESRPPASPALPDPMTATVIADAVRFISWGREWPQLASSIARLADRPPEEEVRKILREHRAIIEDKARRAPD